MGLSGWPRLPSRVGEYMDWELPRWNDTARQARRRSSQRQPAYFVPAASGATSSPSTYSLAE